MNRRSFLSMIGLGSLGLAVGAALAKFIPARPEVGYYFARFERVPDLPVRVDGYAKDGFYWINEPRPARFKLVHVQDAHWEFKDQVKKIAKFRADEMKKVCDMFNGNGDFPAGTPPSGLL